MEHITLKSGFLLKKTIYMLANMQDRRLWKAVIPPSEAFYLNY